MELAQPQNLSPCSSGRRSSVSNSPEFEFWMVRNNPSGFPQPNLLSADELFVDGVLLPLHLLQLQHQDQDPDPPPSISEPEKPPNTISSSVQAPESISTPGPEVTPTKKDSTSASKRWKDLFKKSDKKKQEDSKVKVKEEEKKRDKKSGSNSNSQSGMPSSELNINIWPFSRSRSDGNGGPRVRAAGTRKVSSAPCSRSNSQGESKSRKWPSSPSRAGVHLGRSSPVWQVRRGALGAKSSSETVVRKPKASGGGGGRARVLNLNVPMCIGYKQQFGCRSDESSVIGGGVRASGDGDKHSGGGINGNNLASGVTSFNLRSLFTKKVH